MKLSCLIPSLIALFVTAQLYSQTIEGIVINSQTNNPVSGANISIKYSTTGTFTDSNGRFSLKIESKKNNVMLVSFVGFESQEIELESQTLNNTVEIMLEPTNIQLNKSVVVTASRNELVSFATPDAVSVFTKQQFQQNAPRSMAESLIGATGVWMQKTNHGGGSPFVRGLTGNQTLLLIDGIRLNNATFRYGPNQYFNTIDVFSVDRVEVIRGKGSVLYGSDALGGVINVITRSPEYFAGKPKIGSWGKLKYMNKGMERSALGELKFQSKNFALLGNVGYKNFGDIFAGGDLGYERPSGYDELGFNLNAKIRLGSSWQLKWAFQYVKQNKVPRFDQVAQRGYQTYLFDPQIHQLAYAKLEYFGERPLFRKMKITLSNQFSDETRKLQKVVSPIYQLENDKIETIGISVEVNSEIGQNWLAVTGAEFYSDMVESSRTETNLESGEQTTMRGLYPNNSDMHNLAFFSQHTLKINTFSFTLGGRFNTFRIHSVDNEFGEVTLSPNSLVGNFSVQYFVSQKHQFIASAYSAFRAPNINDISSFGLFDYGIEIPSTDLSPENSFTVEGGYKQSTERFSTAISIFNNRLKNQIVREKAAYNGSSTIDGEQVYKKQNQARSNIMGVEFESGWQLTRQFSFINNLTWLRGKNLENDKPMRRIPPLSGKLALQYNKSGIFGEAEFLFAAKQDRLSGGDIDDHRIPNGGTPGWNIMNLKAGFAWKTISLNAGLQNIFNKAYRIHGSGVDGYGRSFWILLQFEI